MNAVPWSVRIARRLHRVLLVLVKRDVRHAYRSEMIATFEQASADAGRRGFVALLALLFHEAKDLATSSRANRPAPFDRVVTAAAPERSRGDWIHGSLWRQAVRSLVRRPAYLAAAVLTLGFGTGITAAVFALVDTVLIKPLPYPDADRLATVYESSPTGKDRLSLLAPGRIEDWNRLNHTFVAISGSYAENVTDTSGAEPERLEGRRVGRRFFAVYGTPPLVGRWFTAEEDEENGPASVIISERLWTRRFGRNPSAIGRALTIGGRSYTIVGVMPTTFSATAIDVWLPAQLSPFLMKYREARFFTGVGRLRPGVTIEAAKNDLVSVQAALAKEFPKTDAGWSALVGPLKQQRIGNSGRGLMLVFGAVASLWIIAVANIAGLTLVQVHRRGREMAIRAALGASRSSVIGTMTREGLVIAATGGLLGAAVAGWLVSIMPALLTAMPRSNELTLDWRALLFVAATNLAAAAAFSIAPAFVGTRSPLGSSMAAGSRTVAGGNHRLQQGLVIGQVALSVLLVGAATLLLRSYHNLTRVDTGFDPANTITFHVGARWDENRSRIGQMQQQLLTRLEELPHVQSAGFVNFLPATGATLRYQIRVDGVTGPNPDGSMDVGARMIGGGYLRTLKAPLVAGSWCPSLWTDFKAPRYAIVNRRFVEVYAPNQNLVGRTARQTFAESASPLTIAGVVGDIIEDGQGTNAFPFFYTCDAAGSWPDPEYVVRSSDPRALATDVRRIIHELDPARAIFGMRPIQDVLDDALDQPRLDAAMIGLFATAALILAAIGLYSLFMLVVSERTREMALRLAIGAEPRQMIQLVMTDAGRLMIVGLVIGFGLTAASGRLLRGAMFGVGTFDVRALAAAALTLVVVAGIAVAGPALKAARVAPIDALKGE
jgi:putative ABC transport system permease protein